MHQVLDNLVQIFINMNNGKDHQADKKIQIKLNILMILIIKKFIINNKQLQIISIILKEADQKQISSIRDTMVEVPLIISYNMQLLMLIDLHQGIKILHKILAWIYHKKKYHIQMKIQKIHLDLRQESIRLINNEKRGIVNQRTHLTGKALKVDNN